MYERRKNQFCSGTMTGVEQLKTVNLYQMIQSETMSNQSKGISVIILRFQVQRATGLKSAVLI